MQRTLVKSFSPDLRRKIRKDDDKMKSKKVVLIKRAKMRRNVCV